MKMPRAAVGFASSALLSLSPSFASSTNGFGNVTGVYGTSNGAILFSTDATQRSSVPSCGSNNPQRWAIDASTTAGQAAASLLITAWSQHKRVWVTGTGVCSIWGDTETVSFFNVED